MKNMKNSKIRKNQHGYTLVELLISMLIGSFVLLGLMQLLLFSVKISFSSEGIVERSDHAVLMQSILTSTVDNAGLSYAASPADYNTITSAAASAVPNTVVLSNSDKTATYSYLGVGSAGTALCTVSLSLYADSDTTLSVKTASADPALCVTGSAQNPSDYAIPVGPGWSFQLSNTTNCPSGTELIATQTFSNSDPIEVSTCA